MLEIPPPRGFPPIGIQIHALIKPKNRVLTRGSTLSEVILESQLHIHDKDKFLLRDNLLLVVGIFLEGQSPQIYLIPSTVWLEPNSLFTSKDYDGLKSKPEWGLNLSNKNVPLLLSYLFNESVFRLN
jgi:hypothetical protein